MSMNEMTSSDKTAVCFAALAALAFTVLIVGLVYANTRPRAVQTCPKCGFTYATAATPDHAGDREKETP